MHLEQNKSGSDRISVALFSTLLGADSIDSVITKSQVRSFFVASISAPTKVLDKMLNCDPTDL